MSTRPPATFLDRVERSLLIIIAGAVVLLIALLGFATWHTRQMRAAAAASTPGQVDVYTTITIVVDYGDGSQRRLVGIPHTPGMSVLDAMNLATGRPHPIQFQGTGSGPTALITQIDDVRNEAGSMESKAWQYWVNTQYGDTSVGVATLKAGDRISWAFKKYEPNPGPPPQ